MRKKRLIYVLFCVSIVLQIISCKKKDVTIENKQRPNILVAIMDDATYQHLGAYGCNWINTPNFDRVAKNGILFSRAYTPNAKCAPSRASILTGRNSWQLEEGANHWCHFPSKFKTYAEVLSQNNYHVGYTDKGWAPGIALDTEGNKRLMTGVAYNKKETKPPTSEISTNDYAENFKDFLQANKTNKPFCFWYGSREPHRLYERGSGIAKGQKKISQIDSIYSFWPDNKTVRSDLLDYAFEIEYFDEQLGKMLQTLEDNGQLDNTLVLVTSDNGMPFPRIKGQEYELSNHLPLAVMWKNGIKAPHRVIDDFVSFTDFAPTFLEIAGVNAEKNVMKPMIGKSLIPLFNSDKSGIIDAERDHVLIGKERHDVGRPKDVGYPIRGIVKGDYLFIQNFETSRWPSGDPVTGYLNCDGGATKTLLLDLKKNSETRKYWELSFGKRPELELYNIKKDVECMHNLALLPENSQRIKALKKQLYTELKAQKDPRILGKGYLFDQYTYADPTGVNFYERHLSGEKLDAGWVNPSDFEDKKAHD